MWTMIDVINFLKGKPRKNNPKTDKIMQAWHDDLLEEKIRRDYEEDIKAEVEQLEREDEERYLNKLWEE